MISRPFPIWFILALVMALTILIGDILLKISEPNGYHQFFSIFVLLYLGPYLWISTKERQQPPFLFIICFFLLLRFYSIVIWNTSDEVILLGGGDAITYHIPRAELINGDYFSYLLRIGGDINGRITHIFLAIYIEILNFFKFGSSYQEIHNIAFIFNTLISIGTLSLYYVTVLIHTDSKLDGQRAVWFLAMNPYFFGITSLPQKEALLFFGLALFSFSLVIKNMRNLFLILSLSLIAFERIYMVPLLVFIFLGFDGKVTIQKFSLLLFAIFFIEWFIGIETAFEMAKSNQDSLIELDGSALDGIGFLSNVIRTYFGPYALRHFSTEYIVISFFSLSHYLLFIFYPYIAIKALLSPKKFGFAICVSYLYALILIPFHSSFKILMVVFFGGLFLNKIFPISDNYVSSKKSEEASMRQSLDLDREK